MWLQDAADCRCSCRDASPNAKMAKQATRALSHRGNWLHTIDIKNENAIILVIVVFVVVVVVSPPLKSMSQTMHIVDNIGLATNKYPIPIFMSVDCPFPSSLTNRLVNTSAMDINTIGTDVIILRNFSRYPMHDVSLHCT
jgi:hypothetical protein